MPLRHDSDAETCPLCSEKLQSADPQLVEWFLDMKKHFPSLHIAWAFRSKEDQDRACKEGASQRPWPTSKHNFMRDGLPCAQALDVFELDENERASFSPRFYFLISELTKKLSFKNVEWSGEWRRFKELMHFQLK